MIVVGLTGNLASGKSTDGRIFRKSGALVFDADGAARKALRRGSPVYAAVPKLFGKKFLKPNGELDRKKLAWHVFMHPADLKKLNTLVHPGVIFECLKVISRNRPRKGLLVLDVPLLFESHMQNLADFTVVVSAPTRMMIKRAVAKGVPERLARRILATQWPLARKQRLADFVIRNSGSEKELERQILAVIQRIKTNL